jgi:hypothetical protein
MSKIRIRNNGKKSIMTGVDEFIRPGKWATVEKKEGERICKLYDFVQSEADLEGEKLKTEEAEKAALDALELVDTLEKENGDLKKKLEDAGEKEKELAASKEEISKLKEALKKLKNK